MIAVDTSIIVAALWVNHAEHVKARSFLVENPSISYSQHARAEVFSVLTGSGLHPRRSPAGVMAVMDELLRSATVTNLDPDDYEIVISAAVRLSAGGGALFDALHLRAAEKAEVERFVTFNLRDFRRFEPMFSVPVTGL